MRLRVLFPVAVLALGAVVSLVYLSSQPQQSTFSVSPTDDSYVARDFGALSSPLDSRNFGSSPSMVTAYSFTTSNHTLEYTYLRFDLRGIDPSQVEGASLRLYLQDLALTGSSSLVDVHYVNNSNWSERTLNYDDAPPFENQVVAQVSVFGKGQWVTFDLTTLVKAYAPQPVSVMVGFHQAFINKTEFISFNSTRAAADAPQLVLSETLPPSSIAVFATSTPGLYLSFMIVACALVGVYLWLRGRGQVAPGPACPHCGKPVKFGYRVCPYCGQSLEGT